MNAIPEKFYKGENQPKARTVGELRAILAELPDDFPLFGPWDEPLAVVVYNHGCESQYATVEAADDEDDEVET